MPVVEVSSESLLTAFSAAKKLLVTTVRFCLAAPFAAGGPCEETGIAGDCLSHWGSDLNELRKALAVNGVSEALSRANPHCVNLCGVKAASHHAALFIKSWNQLRYVQLICGLRGDVPVDIDPAGVTAGHYRTMAGVMRIQGDIDYNAARIDLLKDYERATDRMVKQVAPAAQGADEAGRDVLVGANGGDKLALIVDLTHLTATFDGVTYEIKSSQALRWLRVLVEHPNEWISGPELTKYDQALDGVRTDKLRPRLPTAILKLIDSETGRGSRIRLGVTMP